MVASQVQLQKWGFRYAPGKDVPFYELCPPDREREWDTLSAGMSTRHLGKWSCKTDWKAKGAAWGSLLVFLSMWASLVAWSAMQQTRFNAGDWFQCLGQKDPRRKEWLPNPAYPRISAWWATALGVPERVSHDWMTNTLTFFFHMGKWLSAPLPMVLATLSTDASLFVHTCDALGGGCTYAQLFSRVWTFFVTLWL